MNFVLLGLAVAVCVVATIAAPCGSTNSSSIAPEVERESELQVLSRFT